MNDRARIKKDPAGLYGYQGAGGFKTWLEAADNANRDGWAIAHDAYSTEIERLMMRVASLEKQLVESEARESGLVEEVNDLQDRLVEYAG